MKTTPETGASASSFKQAVFESAPGQSDTMIQESLSESGTAVGPSQKRGAQGWGDALVALSSLPEVRVWYPLVAKGVGAALVLCCVAFLGHQSRLEESYGQVEPKISGKAASHLQSSEFPGPKASPSGKPKLQPAEAHSDTHLAAHSRHDPKKSKGARVPPPCAKTEKKTAQGITSDGRVILNEASASELTTLPGVGKSRAEAIVKLRERLGRFRKVSDLLRIRGIGWRTLGKMKDKLILDRPKEKEQDPKAAELGKEGAAGGVARRRESSGDSHQHSG